MELHDRIKQCRQNVGLTQEQVAEAMNVSRQAVTKWENGKSAPSTENLFKLASLFGTTVDFLLPEHEDRQLETKNKKRYLILRSVLFTVVWYLFVFLIGFCIEKTGLAESKYLILWLLSSGAYLTSIVVILAFSVIGWRRVALSLDIACLVGLLAGEVFGPNPEGASMGFGHYGWAIWIGVMLVGLVAGLTWEMINLSNHVKQRADQ